MLQRKSLFTLSLIDRKKTFDALGIHIMDDSDFEVAEKMDRLLPEVNPNFYITGSVLTSEEAYERSYKFLKLFGSTYIDKAFSNAFNAEIKKVFDNIHCFTTNVQYKVDDKTKKIDKNSGTVNHFKTPKVFDEVSPLWIAHEHIHSLKETHYDEYQDSQVLGDVIPMFLELVNIDSVDKNIQKSLIANRLYFLKNESGSLRQVREFLDGEDKELYNVFATSSMQYLNSFYYALKLYNMYKSDEKEVLCKVKEVLDGTKNTRTILKELGITKIFKQNETKQDVKRVLKRLQ